MNGPPLGRQPNPEEARVLQRLADGRWRSTAALGGRHAITRLHRLAARQAIVVRRNAALRGFQWRRPDPENA